MIRTWNEKKLLSKKVINQHLEWTYANWIYNNTSELMQKAVGFEIGVEKTVSYTYGVEVNLGSLLSASFSKTVSWAQTITKVDTTTINIKPKKKGTIKYQTGWCDIEIIVRETFTSRETNGMCGIISRNQWHEDHRSVVRVKVHLGDAVGIEEPIEQSLQVSQQSAQNSFGAIQRVMAKLKEAANTAALNSKQFGTRLCAHSNGHVNLSTNNSINEHWVWQWISPNKFHWKSRAHGTYLRAWPDGHLDLTTNRDAWEVWTKIDCGSHIFWQSHFGTFLCGNPDQTVCLTNNQLAHQFWTH